MTDGPGGSTAGASSAAARTAAGDPGDGEQGGGRSHTANAVLISVVAAIGGFLFGFDTAVINGAVDALSGDFELSPGLTGFAVSSALLGCATGAWFAGGAADRFGRPKVMIIASVLFTASAIGSGLAFGVWDLILWRVVGGLGVGTASVIAPAYIAEIAPAAIRGRLGSLQQLAIVTGIFVALLSDAFLAGAAGGAAEELWLGLTAWRWMFLSELVPAVAYGLLALTIPESPRFLVARGEDRRARTVLLRLMSGESARERIDAIKKSLQGQKAVGLSNLRGAALGLQPIVWVGIALSLFQQLVGINVIFYYSTTLWRSVGFEESDALTVTVITSVTNVAVTVVAILLVDRIGRRPLLLIGSTAMTAALATMAVCFSQATGSGEDVSLAEPWSTVALVAANVFVVGFGVSWGPVVWVLLGEMFPNRLRAPALAVAAAAQWVANFAVSTTFPWLSENAGLAVTYGGYAAFALLSGLFVATVVQETKGRELEDMTGETGRRRKDLVGST
ncbi:sugar porter family MFS transporter [Aquipuribacter nitratireducens]|uniref:Sugar porter family MFS transporter n=1 Tax=Aquipuribacter nitratireducens TaxID=650104 RepID=A0ABW0GQE6_9MICO